VIEPILDAVSPAETVGRLLDSAHFQGVILAPPLCENPEVLDAIGDRGVPCVRIAPSIDREDMGAVRTDDRYAARHATRYLMGLGHRDIAFICGPRSGPAAIQRLAGFREAVREMPLPFVAQYESGDFTFRSGFEAAQRLLAVSRPPSAIFAANDEMAFGAIAACHRIGLSVPQDISVIGFDDSPAARAVWPQLTTVRQPIREMAAAAAALLVEGQAGKSPRSFESELVVRGSSGNRADA
jgi:LacI family transcriptional regulator